MREYYIYWMKEDIVLHYFGKEALVYNLFKALEEADEDQKMVLRKQIHFITKPVPISTLQKFLRNNMATNEAVDFDLDTFSVYLDDNDGFATLKFENDYLVVRADGSSEAEIIWFEKLRRFAPSFFAYEIEKNLCGWLSPIKHTKKYV